MRPVFRLVALGVPFVVRGLDAWEGARMAVLWPWSGAMKTERAEVEVVVGEGADGRAARALDRTWPVGVDQSAVAAASAAVNVTAVAVTPYVAVHAAVLTRDGRTVVLPGSSGSGKSTAAAVLLRSGWGYVSDEALALNDEGAVVPYPRPLGLSRWTAGRLAVPVPPGRDDEVLLTAGELGGRVDLTPGAPTTVLLTAAGGRGAVEVSAPHRMAALEQLVQRAFTRHTDPVTTMQRLAAAVRRCEVVLVAGPGPVERAHAVLAVLEGRAD